MGSTTAGVEPARGAYDSRTPSMTKDPWTDPDPQPGDFDRDLVEIDPRYVDAHQENPDAKLTIVVGIEDEDAERLQRLAAERGQRPGDVISSLLRSA
jgi:hypothetical protein